MKNSSGRSQSKRMRPSASRRFSVECLEPRTVLSASSMLVIAIDTTVFASPAPGYARPNAYYGESVLMDRQGTFVQTIHVAPRTSYVASPPLIVTLGGPNSSKRFVAPPANPLPRPVVTVPPVSKPPRGEVVVDGPEGEFVPPDHGVRDPQVSFANLIQPVHATQPETVVHSSRSVPVNDTVIDRNAPLAIGGLSSMISATDWWYDTSNRRESSALDVSYGLRTAESTFEVQYAELQVGQAVPRNSVLTDRPLEISPSTWRLEEVLSDILLPQREDSTDLLSAADEGGFVDVRSSADVFERMDMQRAARALAMQANPSHSQRITHDNSRQEHKPDRHERSWVVDPEAAAAESVRGNVHHETETHRPVAASATEEGGLIESISAAVSTCLTANEAVAAQQILSLGTTEIRIEAEVGYYQAFELSTTPRTATPPVAAKDGVQLERATE